jgi:hypothetical protein
MVMPSCHLLSSALKMEAIYSSETSVDFQKTTLRYVPEDRTFLASYFMSFEIQSYCNIQIQNGRIFRDVMACRFVEVWKGFSESR